LSLQGFTIKVAPKLLERLWDIFCITSIIGIWPRYIEPKLLRTTFHTIPIPTLPHDLDGLKIVQISDLHFSAYSSKRFLNRIKKKIQRLSPDIIVFTGDLLSYAELMQEELLHEFLLSINAPLGSFAILGNHDYSDYVSYGEDGSYRRVHDHIPPLLRGFARLFSPKLLSPIIPLKEPVAPLDALMKLFQTSGFTVLHNETIQIGSGTQQLNITGLGDLIAGQCDPQKAFASCNHLFPTIVLSHNPDSYQELKYYPGNLLLFGHTHGGQVNLPLIWKKVTPLKDRTLKSGLVIRNGQQLYINRGLGSTFPFRWFASPEIALFRLVRQGLETVTNTEFLFTPVKETLAPALRSLREIK